MPPQTSTPEWTTPESRWAAVLDRNPSAEGHFFYAVTTTGIFCRPTCSSRRPRPENVRFFADTAAAQAAGFRPCQRCQPTAAEPPHTAAIRHACGRITHAEQEPTLADLAAEAGLSHYHFQRVFKKVVGISPKQYALQQRAARVRQQLQETAAPITEAVYEAGFGSSSGFYGQATAVLGMKPTTYQNGAQDMRIQFATRPCYLGWVLVAATPHGICAIDLGDDPAALVAALHGRFPHAHILAAAASAPFSAQVDEILTFLEAPQQASFNLPLDIQGTAFQRRVWQALQAIPAGQTASYGQIAAQLGQPRAMRAVAQACAANRLAIAIPCHRVVRGDGSLGGYRWGVARKALLLAREQAGG